MGLNGSRLPDFPWDSLAPIRELAAKHPEGAVDLTIGTPVDPVPAFIQEALVSASNAHSYPTTVGTAELRAAITSWLANRRGVAGEPGVLPTLGSKEMVALLPSLLGLGEGDIVAFPQAAYPTYDVGARLAGARPLPIDPLSDPMTWPEGISLVWLNSPGNPDGHVLDVEHLRRIVAWARIHNVILASDECYAELCWEVPEAPSLLDERVCGQDYTGLFALYSLSKQSNLAGYRAAFIAGDSERIDAITQVRKHSGFLMPTPVQHAMALALGDEKHVLEQKAIYQARRETLLPALAEAGLVNDPLSVAGLYFWVGKEGFSAWDIVRACAQLGIIVTPGTFYGEAGGNRVRISLTAPDSAVKAACERLRELPKILESLKNSSESN